jgi:hypothetical protein
MGLRESIEGLAAKVCDIEMCDLGILAVRGLAIGQLYLGKN